MIFRPTTFRESSERSLEISFLFLRSLSNRSFSKVTDCILDRLFPIKIIPPFVSCPQSLTIRLVAQLEFQTRPKRCDKDEHHESDRARRLKGYPHQGTELSPEVAADSVVFERIRKKCGTSNEAGGFPSNSGWQRLRGMFSGLSSTR